MLRILLNFKFWVGCLATVFLAPTLNAQTGGYANMNMQGVFKKATGDLGLDNLLGDFDPSELISLSTSNDEIIQDFLHQTRESPEREALVRNIFYSRSQIANYQTQFDYLPDNLLNTWRDYFTLLEISSSTEQELARERLLDWGSFQEYTVFLETRAEELKPPEEEVVENDESEEETSPSLAEKGKWLPADLTKIQSDKYYEPFVFEEAPTMVWDRPIIELKFIDQPTYKRMEANTWLDRTGTRKKVEKAAKHVKKATGFLKRNLPSGLPFAKNKKTPLAEDTVGNSKGDGITLKAPAGLQSQTKYAKDTKSGAEYSISGEDKVIINWLAQKRVLQEEKPRLPPNEVERHRETSMDLIEVNDDLKDAAFLKNKLGDLARNKDYKYRPIYFAENSSHASSAKFMEDVQTIMVTNYTLSYGFKMPVTRKNWPDLLAKLPANYLDLCALGITGLAQLFNGDGSEKRWVWLADEEGNQVGIGKLPIIKFKDKYRSAGSSLLKERMKNSSISGGVAKPYAGVDISHIDEIYFAVVVHINMSNRSNIEWVECEPSANQKFRIVLGPEELRHKLLEEQRGVGQRKLKQDVLDAVDRFEKKRPGLKVDALLNLHFYALGVRNLAMVELINLNQTKNMERKTSGFKFTFGAGQVMNKSEDLEHEVQFDDSDLPSLRGDSLDRAIQLVSNARSAHPMVLHINPKVMFDYSLEYLATDMKTIGQKAVTVR